MVDYLTSLGDIDIQEHLNQSSSQATYISKTSVGEYLTCISNHPEDGLLLSLITTKDFSISADKTIDISDMAK